MFASIKKLFTKSNPHKTPEVVQEPSGAFAGGIWMCKIKTQAYIDKLKEQFKDNWQQYGE